MKCVLRAWGQLKRGFEVLALGEMCFEGMGRLKRGSRCWHSVKYVLTAWGGLKRVGKVLALVEMRLMAWGQLKRGFEVLALCEICFEGMRAVEKGV